MRIPLLSLLLPLLLTALLAACGGKSSSGWTPVDPKSMTPTQTAQQAKGLKARQELFSKLIARLSQALAEGPDKAIHACNIAAPEIAAAVAAAEGLRIGRTSHRLRNPKNEPPEWARRHVAKRSGEPLWLTHEDGRLAGLLPIGTMPLCITCHGPWAGIARPVRKALAELYPEDRAIEFKPGDLRGWFWLEIPKP